MSGTLAAVTVAAAAEDDAQFPTAQVGREDLQRLFQRVRRVSIVDHDGWASGGGADLLEATRDGLHRRPRLGIGKLAEHLAGHEERGEEVFERMAREVGDFARKPVISRRNGNARARKAGFGDVEMQMASRKRRLWRRFHAVEPSIRMLGWRRPFGPKGRPSQKAKRASGLVIAATKRHFASQ